MGASFSGGTMRLTRTMMLEVLRQDYIRTAWSKGLTERVVIMRHALKNAMLPVVTVIGLSLPMLIAGGVIFEQIFSPPGIGRYLLDAVGRRDYPIDPRREPGHCHGRACLQRRRGPGLRLARSPRAVPVDQGRDNV